MRSQTPLGEDQTRQAAPSIFATGKRASRSKRYSNIPTIEVLHGLRKEGFEPFMVAQGRSRIEGKTEITKHMVRTRHANQVTSKAEANESILISSHDGASSCPLISGAFHSGLVVGDGCNDIRVRHRGGIENDAIEGAFPVLADFEAVDASIDGMKAVQLDAGNARAFAIAAFALRFGSRVWADGDDLRIFALFGSDVVEVLWNRAADDPARDSGSPNRRLDLPASDSPGRRRSTGAATPRGYRTDL